MSKTLLMTADVPKYIQEIVTRLYQTTDYTENDVAGYTFKLFGKWKLGFECQLRRDCETLIAWCKRYYADAYITSEHFWSSDVEPSPYGLRGDKAHRRSAYQQGYRNFIKVVITDPVARRFEKDGYYREGVAV